MTLTQGRLHELLDYNPETGEMIWKATHGPVRAESVAGYIDQQGYRRICIDGRLYQQSRLIWFYMTSEWPHKIDHKDRNPLNNSWGNLREANNIQSGANRSRPRNNTSGYKGVWQQGNKWIAHIKINNKGRYLGTFKTKEDAARAYNKAALDEWGEFACLNLIPANDNDED